MSKTTYQAAGVDIEKADDLVEAIKPIAKRTHRPEMLTGLGGFGALCEIPLDRYQKPVLVSGTDGVGTKLRLAIDAKHYAGVGIDLVAMCVNDIITCGAEPLFFLDYYATGALDNAVAAAIIASIGEGCLQSGCALAGGETAEMPGMYSDGDLDLAGFCVGVVDKDKIIDGKQRVQPGDQLIALGSSGVHSNGFSLVRHIIKANQIDLDTEVDGAPLIQQLLAPTRIYAKAILALCQAIDVHGMAHITGGGLPGNVTRMLPENCIATLNGDSWSWPELFCYLARKGNVGCGEMLKTFNCGIGMVIAVSKTQLGPALALLAEQGETAWHVGEVIAEQGAASVRISRPTGHA